MSYQDNPQNPNVGQPAQAPMGATPNGAAPNNAAPNNGVTVNAPAPANAVPQAAPSHVAQAKPGPSANRIVAGAFGIAFLLLGALSFTALSDPKFIGDNGELLFGAFQVNGLLIIARIVLGLVLLLATRDTIFGSARTNIGAGVVALLIAVSSPFIDNATEGGVFALAQADYVFFVIAAVALISVGVFSDRSRNADIVE